MAVEIPIVCQGNNVLAEIGTRDVSDTVVRMKVEIVGTCPKLGTNNRCDLTGLGCFLKETKKKAVIDIFDEDEIIGDDPYARGTL